MITDLDIVRYARTWIGVPWVHQGRGEGPKKGIDCAGLLLVVARHFALPNGDMQGYRRDPAKGFQRNIMNHTVACKDKSLWNGAIAIFSDTNQPCHTGIFAVDPHTGKLTVIHSEAFPANRCHEENFDNRTPSLRDRLIAVRHFKEVDYGRRSS